MIKKVLLLVFLTVFITCGCAPKNTEGDLYQTILKRGKMIVGISFDSKPFGFVEKNGKVSGFEADLAKEIAYNLLGDPNKVEFKNLAPQERTAAVLSGNVDMVISTMTITSERKKFLYFSEPYFISGQAICVKKDGKIDSHYDLLNKKVIVILGTTGERNIKRFAPNALIMGFDDNSEAISEFKSGVGDALTTDDSLLQGLVMDNDKYIILPERLTQEPYGIAFKKSKQTKSLKNKINEILETMRYDGTLDNIYNKWGL
jgi:putative glutamine transport system substrate-binding protein